MANNRNIAQETQNLDLLDERSDKVKEILGKTPNWMIRWGTSIVFIIMAMLLVGAAVISYNDIIPARIVITTKNPPVYLKTRTSGRLTRILVEPNDEVVENTILAEIENTANFDDVVWLGKRLDNFEAERMLSLDSLEMAFPPDLDLGPLQLPYGDFLTQYQNFLLFNTLEPNVKEASLIRRQLAEQRQFLRNQQRQLGILRKDLELAKRNFERYQKLLKKGVISNAEFEQISREYLSDQQQYEAFFTNISNTQISIANFNNLLTKASIQGTEFENNYEQDLNNALQNLRTALGDWEQQYLLKSPIRGRVTLFDIWNQYQNVAVGETLFTIVPQNTAAIIGRVTLPVRNSGKVKAGQKLIIKLDNYPFEEWGSLAGEIKSISEVPKEGEETFYTLYVTIDGLKTSYGKQIDFKQEMQGTAEIVVEELSVLERIFYELRKVFSRS